MWKWREWVIGAFNANQPFDEFTVEQIAGDLLPGATRSQRLATGFQRNHTIFTKPGAADDEYRHAYVVDRVNTTATVWMGLTLACAQCHDHKYDPFSQAEYYSLYAYFNNVSEDDVGRGRGNTRPVMVVPDAEQGAELDSLAERIEELDGYLTGDDAELDAGQERWAREALERLGEPVEWVPIEPAGSLSLGGALLELQEDGSILATGPSPAADVYHVVARPGRARITALRLEVLPHESFENGGSGRSEKGTFQLNELEVYLSSVLQGNEGERVRFLRGEDDVAPDRSIDADKAVDGSERSGWSLVEEDVAEPHAAVFLPDEPLELNARSVLRFVFQQSFGRRYRTTVGRFRLSYTEDERVLRRRLPVVPGTWHSVGPFPAETAGEALSTVFDPERDVPGGVDLEAQYAKVELAAGEGGGPGGKGPKKGSAKKPQAEAAVAAVVTRAASGGEADREPAPEAEETAAPPIDEAAETAPAPARAADEVAPAPPEVAEEPRFDFDDFDPDDFDPDDLDPDDLDPGAFGGPGGRRRRGDDSKLAWEGQEDWRDGGRVRLSGKHSAHYLHRVLDADRARTVRILYQGEPAMRVWLGGEQVFERPAAAESGGRRSYGGGFGDFEQRAARAPDYDWFDLELEAGENELVLKVVTGERGAQLTLRTQARGNDVLSLAAETALRRELAPRDAPLAAADHGGEHGPCGENGRPMSSGSADEDGPSPAGERRRLLREWYRRYGEPGAGAKYDELDRLRLEVHGLEAELPTSMVLDEEEPRETHVLVRGAYDQPGERVRPGVPAVLPPLAAPGGGGGTRLDLARWLVADAHPLTARVTVNRIWRQYFGTGLVATTNDFGTRGDLPSHPALLDWLATELAGNGWDLKALHRLIVTSATYRQSSRVRPEHLERDPGNRLLARGPRLRLSAEMVRDGALAVSGLLVEEIGGESVKPYQPKGLWQNVGGFSSSTYRPDQGDKLYRRGIYVFWKRGILYPSFAIFDAPARATCVSERVETNTPLQSLVLLNDPVYVEAARALASRLLTEVGGGTTARLLTGFRLCTSRLPDERELEVLTRVYAEQRDHYDANPRAAEELVAVGESAIPAELDPTELAAWTAVCSVLLSLDATLHRG